MKTVLSVVTWLALVTTVVVAGAPNNRPDAALRAVSFVDRDEGWAAGDDGAIWHTIDGGTTWEPQSSGVRASLRGICFLNPFTGWIVGREEMPNGAGSTGIILSTSDGGQKWTRQAQNVLPGLHAVKFFTDRLGIVAGEGSDALGSGVFFTDDGGRSWKPVVGPRQPGWLTADFADPKTGAMAGPWSSLAILRDSVFGKSDIDTLGGRSIHCLKIFGAHAVAAGQGGLILYSRDTAGARWSIPTPKCLSRDSLSVCDFNAVAHLGEHIWVAGRPGSIVLHSGDYGKTWECSYTHQNLPLHGLCFVDPRNGWAVGELGTVLQTEDGGKSWTIQHRGEDCAAQRAAALLIHGSVQTLPLEALAALGADDGYLTAALRVTSADPGSAPLSRASEPARWVEAVRRAGGAGGESLWQFPLPAHCAGLSAKDTLAEWDKAHGNRAAEMLLGQLVLAIRMWQPEVIITDPSGKDDSLVDVAVREAFHRAADAKAFPEQIEQLGLKPWEVKKLYGVIGSDGDKALPEQVTLDATRPLPRQGDTIHDIAEEAAALLFDTPARLPNVRAFHLRESRLPDAGKHQQIMDGISLAHGGTARRKLPGLSASDLAAIDERAKAAQTKRNIAALANDDFKGLGGPDRMLGQFGSMLKSLPVDQGASAAYAVASNLAKSGQWHLAREAFIAMVDRYPSHPLSLDAYRWLARYSSSSEARRRHELGQFQLTTYAEIRPAFAPANPGDRIQQSSAPEMVQVQELTLLGSMAEARRWYECALQIEPRLLGFGPIFARDPAIQVCMNSARRTLGNPDAARQWYSKFLADNANALNDPVHADPWREIAAAEMWLSNRTARPPRPVGLCQQTVKRPYLDGLLDDPCWQDAKPLPLRNVSGDLGADWTAKAFFAYDQDFLYVAVQCLHPVGKQAARVAKRERDMDLRAFDRIGIMLDMDRDYQTYYHFEVDQRGALAEDCWGDKTWNPKWYVAVNSDETSWTAEIAIPRAELTGDPFTLGKVWACNIVRVVPGKGVQAWSRPADVDPRPEGMGLLIFAQDKK
jgi:photosystem II stability/assembly factor-like uncharacterized protein